MKGALEARYHGNIPMDETVVSPAALFEDPNLIEVFNNYSADTTGS